MHSRHELNYVLKNRSAPATATPEPAKAKHSSHMPMLPAGMGDDCQRCSMKIMTDVERAMAKSETAMTLMELWR